VFVWRARERGGTWTRRGSARAWRLRGSAQRPRARRSPRACVHVSGLGFHVSYSRFHIPGFVFRVSCLVFRISCFGFPLVPARGEKHVSVCPTKFTTQMLCTITNKTQLCSNLRSYFNYVVIYVVTRTGRGASGGARCALVPNGPLVPARGPKLTNLYQ